MDDKENTPSNLLAGIAEKHNTNNLLLGVVSSTECYDDKKCTILRFVTGDNYEMILLAKWNASYIFSKMCVFDIDKYIIYDVNDKDLHYRIICTIYPACNSEKTIECPECNKNIKISNTLNHFREHHFYNILIFINL